MTDDTQTPTSGDGSPIDRAKFEVHQDVAENFTTRVLLPRKRRMVEAYVRTGSYAAAATASGYGSQTVKRYITEDPLVRKAIGEMVDQAAILAGVSLERVMQEYARIAFSDVGELADVIRAAGDSDVALELLAEAPADVTAAIKAIKYERKHSKDDADEYVTGKLDVTFHDKRAALTDLGRMLALFKDTLVIEDKTAFGERLERAVAKIDELSDNG